MKITPAILIFILLGNSMSKLYGQDDLSTEKRFLHAISELRDLIIFSEAKKADRYRKIKMLIDESDLSKSNKEALIFKFITDSEKKYPYNFKDDLLASASFLSFLNIDSVLMIRDSIKMGDYIKGDLIFYDMISPDYPYKPLKLDKWMGELTAYDLMDSMRIADVGAGGGFLSMLINVMYADIHVTATDIDKEVVNSLKARLSVFDPSFSHSFSIIRDDNLGSNLRKAKYDRIIARLSFHHFDNKNKMLEGFKNSLTPSGLVYITEVLSSDKSDNIYCRKLLRKARIRRLLKKAGLTIKEEIKNGEFTIFKCAAKTSQ